MLKGQENRTLSIIEAEQLVDEGSILLFEKQDTINAMKKFLEATNNPIVFRPFGILSFIYLWQNDFEKTVANASIALERAKPFLAKIEDLDDWCIDILENQSIANYMLGNFEHAIMDFTQLIDYNSSNKENYKYRGHSYERVGKHYQALKDFEKAEGFSEVIDVELLYFKSLALFYLEKYQDAYDNLILVQANKYDGDGIDFLLGVCNAKIEKPNYEEVIYHLLKEFRERGEQNIQNSIKWRALSHLGEAYYYTQQYDKAIPILERVSETTIFDEAYFTFLYVNSLLNDGQLKRGEKLAIEYQKDFPREGLADASLAVLSILKGEKEKVKPLIDAAFDRSTTYMSEKIFGNFLLLMYAEIEDQEGQVKVLERMAKADPWEISNHLWLLSYYTIDLDRNSDKIISSLDILHEITAENPAMQAHLMASKAMIYIYIEDFENALASINKALVTDSFAELYLVRANVLLASEMKKQKNKNDHLKGGNWKSIITDIDKGMTLSDRLDEVLYFKAYTFFAYNKIEQGCDALSKAEAINPTIGRDNGIFYCSDPTQETVIGGHFFPLRDFVERFFEM